MFKLSVWQIHVNQTNVIILATSTWPCSSIVDALWTLSRCSHAFLTLSTGWIDHNKTPESTRSQRNSFPSPSVCSLFHWKPWLHLISYTRLYRRLLRAHRFLPNEMRGLGDNYVKAGSHPSYFFHVNDPKGVSPEFRRHKEVTNPVHIIGFLSQWKMYLDQLPRGTDAKSFSGKRLDPTVFEKVSNYSSRGSRLLILVIRCQESNLGNFMNLCTLQKMYGNQYQRKALNPTFSVHLNSQCLVYAPLEHLQMAQSIFRLHYLRHLAIFDRELKLDFAPLLVSLSRVRWDVGWMTPRSIPKIYVERSRKRYIALRTPQLSALSLQCLKPQWCVIECPSPMKFKDKNLWLILIDHTNP